MQLEPFLDVYSGYSLDGTHITGEALRPFVDEVMRELEVSPRVHDICYFPQSNVF